MGTRPVVPALTVLDRGRPAASLLGWGNGSPHVRRIPFRHVLVRAIWQYAAQHGFVVVSKDDDFRQLSFLRGPPPKVIWLVVGNAGSATIADLLLKSLELITAFVDRTEDALLTISTGREDAP